MLVLLPLLLLASLAAAADVNLLGFLHRPVVALARKLHEAARQRRESKLPPRSLPPPRFEPSPLPPSWVDQSDGQGTGTSDSFQAAAPAHRRFIAWVSEGWRDGPCVGMPEGCLLPVGCPEGCAEGWRTLRAGALPSWPCESGVSTLRAGAFPSWPPKIDNDEVVYQDEQLLCRFEKTKIVATQKFPPSEPHALPTACLPASLRISVSGSSLCVFDNVGKMIRKMTLPEAGSTERILISIEKKRRGISESDLVVAEAVRA